MIRSIQLWEDLRKNIPGRGASKCKGPEVGVNVVCGTGQGSFAMRVGEKHIVKFKGTTEEGQSQGQPCEI